MANLAFECNCGCEIQPALYADAHVLDLEQYAMVVFGGIICGEPGVGHENDGEQAVDRVRCPGFCNYMFLNYLKACRQQDVRPAWLQLHTGAPGFRQYLCN